MRQLLEKKAGPPGGRLVGSALFVLLLWAAAGVLWAGGPKPIVVEIKEPQGVQDPEECIKCHVKVNPGLVAAFLGSSMGRPGIQNPPVYEEAKKQRAPKEQTERRKAFLVRNGQITCVLCHTDDHTKISETRGRVANAVCAGCHDSIDQEYEKEGGHSADPPADAWKRALAVPEFFGVPARVLQLSRDIVFAQQGATPAPYFDPDPEFEGSGRIHRNGCVSCHTRHGFDVAEARKSEGCQMCHSQAGNSLFDAYLQSKHGSIYKSEGKNWNWKIKMPEALPTGEYRTPTCASCHMLQAERYGDLKITHKMTAKTIWSRGLQPLLVEGARAAPAAYTAYFREVRQQSDEKRKQMILVCRNCHSEKFAGDYLNACDEVKLAGDLLVLEARAVLDRLARDRLLPGPAVARVGQVEVAAAGGGDDSKAAAAKSLPPLTPIERAFLEMARQNVRTALGAFHASPGAVYWGGFADLQKSLENIRTSEKQMRETRTTSTTEASRK